MHQAPRGSDVRNHPGPRACPAPRSDALDGAGSPRLVLVREPDKLGVEPDSTLHELLEDERGRELISKRDVRLLQDPELIKVIGTMPMHTLAAFQGMALSHDELEKLVAEL